MVTTAARPDWSRGWLAAAGWVRGFPDWQVALNVVRAVAGIATFILGALGGVWLLAGVGALLFVACLDVLQHKCERWDAFDAGQEAATRERALTAVLTPLTGAVAEITGEHSKPKRREQLGYTRARIVEAAENLVPGAQRSAYYRLCDSGTALERRSHGEADSPRRRFEPGEPDTEQVLDLVLNGKAILIDDILKDQRVKPSPGSEYRSVLAVAVTAGTQRYGMLTVDSPVPGAFLKSDLNMMRMLASQLGAAIAAYVRP